MTYCSRPRTEGNSPGEDTQRMQEALGLPWKRMTGCVQCLYAHEFIRPSSEGCAGRVCQGPWWGFRAGFEDGVHGCNGLMRVENPRYENPLHGMFFEAAEQAGIPRNDNFNNWGHSQALYLLSHFRGSSHCKSCMGGLLPRHGGFPSEGLASCSAACRSGTASSR